MHRLDLGLYSHPKEFGGGMEFEPMLTPREKSPLPENFPRGGSNPRRCGQRVQTLPTSYSSPDFVQISLHHKLSPARTLKRPGQNGVQITCNTSSACHVQPAVCHVVRSISSATKFDRYEITFILALFYWLKQLTDEGGEETGVPIENP